MRVILINLAFTLTKIMVLMTMRSVFVFICWYVVSGCTSTYRTTPSANFDSRIKSIVIHFTAGPYADSLSALAAPGGLSAHYLIPQHNDPSYQPSKLRIIRLLPDQARAWHAGVSQWQQRTNLNDTSIGIELVYEPVCEQSGPLADAAFGANRRCSFPAFDEAQLILLKRLLNDITKRFPDIHPTAIVGHADIAPQRKNDPGPRFPWEALHNAGFGAWYDPLTFGQYQSMFAQQTPSLLWLERALQAYGYDIEPDGCWDDATSNVITAFHMHFVPELTYAKPQAASFAAIMALLARYMPAAEQTLLFEYQTSTPLVDPICEVEPN